MAERDPCSELVVRTACAFLEVPDQGSHRGQQFLRAFVDDPSKLTLCATRTSDAQSLAFSVQASALKEGDERQLVFFKRRPQVLTAENLSGDVGVCALLAPSAAESLGACLRAVFQPLLASEPLLATSLGQLQAVLGTAHDGGSTTPKGKDEAALGQHWCALGAASLDECADWLDAGLALLEDLRHTKSLDSLHNALGRGLAARLETLLSDLDSWRAPLTKVQQELGLALSACGRSPSADAVLGVRIRTMLQARLTQEQLVRLAPPTTREPLPAAPRLSDPEPEWRAAMALHTQWLAPLAARAAATLRERLMRTTGLSLLQECKSYSELLKHPDVQAQLAPERDVLLRALSECMVEAKKSYEQTSCSIQGVPDVVRDIVGLQELRTRLEEAREVVRLLNDGSNSWETLVEKLNRACDEAREAAADRLDGWSRNAQQIATKTSLQEDEPALILGAGGRPRVSLSPRLASIASEARQLRALGCRLPPGPLRQLEDTAARVGHRARHLQQVASFYSTVADQMIPSQRPLMLGLAEELTGALRQRVPWGDVTALDAFVGRLRGLAARLAGRNRHLRALHLAVCRKVMSLFDLDLVCRQQNWKDVLNDIRATMAQQQESPEQVRPWRAHWDRQLYKALECQYLRGLETLLQYLPETRVELTCRSGQLCFRPPLEEVRSRYYQQVKRFLALPLHFRGVSDDLAVDQSLVFSVIVDRNAHQFVDLYRRTQRLFASVQASAGRFQEWVALSSLDLQTFAEGLSPEEWKNSFRTVKAKCQEFGKAFPDEERFECLVVSYAPVRSHVDFALSELESGLVRELRASVARDAAAVRSYLESSLDALAGSAQTAEELAQLSAAFGRTVAGRDQAAAMHAAARDKQQLLARWSRRPPPADMDGLQQLWHTLDEKLHQHRDVVAHQVG
ncbi:hypothetical protein HPB52_007978 [Rhipicephalus sanguineus]|uniref:Dynein heavy chain tail domain-containing protein n=1 Tax=Rhipicephalus sanguineus TaxID=34632 RepID=A0A9D4Q664_RHISA|nr:hypothetical protein HPB52_007978 [Rhipicephalus sanguineus]